MPLFGTPPSTGGSLGNRIPSPTLGGSTVTSPPRSGQWGVGFDTTYVVPRNQSWGAVDRFGHTNAPTGQTTPNSGTGSQCPACDFVSNNWMWILLLIVVLAILYVAFA